MIKSVHEKCTLWLQLRIVSQGATLELGGLDHEDFNQSTAAVLVG